MDFLPGNDPSEWKYLGESENAVPYQKVTVCEHMQWKDFPLESFVAACAKFSGPVALIWNTDEPLPLNVDVSMSTDVFIFDATGRELSRISGQEWQHSRMIVMGWTLSERFFILFEDGRLYVYSVRGAKVGELKLFDQAFTDLVCCGAATENGCVAYTKTGRLVYIRCDEEEPSIVEYHSLPLPTGNIVTCLACLEERFTESGEMAIIATCWDQSTYYVTQSSVLDLDIRDRFFGRITRMALSPSQDYLALFTSEGWISVVTTNFQTKILDFNVHNKTTPQDFGWCGGDSIVGYWQHHGLLMLSPFCDFLRFEYEDEEEPLFLAHETDCLRILSRFAHEILRCVPPAVFNVYMIGSQSPGARLRHAFAQFTQQQCEQTADEGVGDLTGEDLAAGIRECAEAASEELSSLLQEELLRSVRFGEGFLQLAGEGQQSIIAGIVQKLRVLNAVRSAEIGLFLTTAEYECLKEKAVLARLLSRRLYYLAVKICEYLKVPYDFVLVDWACEKVRCDGDFSAAQLCCLVREKLANHAVSYAQIAWSAFQAGRSELACLLLQYEPRVSDRLPLYLLMGECGRAVKEAAESGDEDMMTFVAVQLYLKVVSGEVGQEQFAEAMRAAPTVFASLCQYVKMKDLEELDAIWVKQGCVEEHVNAIVMKAFHRCELEQRIVFMKEINEQVQKAASVRKELEFVSRMIGEELKVLGFQKEISNTLNERECVNMSVTEMIRYCVMKSQLKQADRIRSVFKIPDKKYWNIKIRALADGEFWDVLFAFANEKKSPVGYSPFVEACLAHNNAESAKMYLPKIGDTKERLQMSLKCKEYSLALEDATKLRDVNALAEIARDCDNSAIRKGAESALASYQK